MTFVWHFLYSVMVHTGAWMAVNQMHRTYNDLVDVLFRIQQDVVYVPTSLLLFHISLMLLSIDIQDVQYALPLFVCVWMSFLQKDVQAT